MVESIIPLDVFSNFHPIYNTEGLKNPGEEILALLTAPVWEPLDHILLVIVVEPLSAHW